MPLPHIVQGVWSYGEGTIEQGQRRDVHRPLWESCLPMFALAVVSTLRQGIVGIWTLT